MSSTIRQFENAVNLLVDGMVYNHEADEEVLVAKELASALRRIARDIEAEPKVTITTPSTNGNRRD